MHKVLQSSNLLHIAAEKAMQKANSRIKNLEYDAGVSNSLINFYHVTRPCLLSSHVEEQLRPPKKISAPS